MNPFKSRIAKWLADKDYRVLSAWIKNSDVPSEGREECLINEAIQTASAELSNHIRQSDQITLDLVMDTLADALSVQGWTKKTNPRNAPEAFHLAERRRDNLIDACLERLPLEYAPILNNRLRHRMYALLVPETAESSPNGRPLPFTGSIRFCPTLRRSERADRWSLSLDFWGETIESVSFEHPYWVRLGHLSERAINIRFAAHPTPLDERHDYRHFVVSVLIEQDENYPHWRTDGPLPVATEFVFRADPIGSDDEPRWAIVMERSSPWREQIRSMRDDALLPHIGDRVRIGDVVIEVSSGLLPPNLLEPIDDPDAFDGFTLPVSLQGGQFFKERHGRSIYWRPKRDDAPIAAEFFHPDHYEVRVIEPEPHKEDRMVRIYQISGQTQYSRRSDGD